MQITRLVIENLRAISHLELDLASPAGDPRRRVLLLGVNGAGKTTILDAITHAFSHLYDSPGMGTAGLGAADVRNVEDPSLEVAAIPRTGAITIDAVLSREERHAVEPLYRRTPAGGRLKFRVGQASIFDDILGRDDDAVVPTDADAGLEYFQVDDGGGLALQFATVARTALLETSPSCVLLPADRGVLEHRDDLTLREIMVLEPRRNCLSRSRDRFAPLAARLALATVGGGRGDESREVARMWKVVEKYFPEMPRLVEAEGMSLRFRSKSGAIVPLSALSDGERAILLILGELALRSPLLGMILIDELEQHLHPRWQRAILQALISLLPSAQFVITTQSPYLAACAPDDVVKLGDWERDGE